MAPAFEQQEFEYSISDSTNLRPGDIANIAIGTITAIATIIVLLIKVKKLRGSDQPPVTVPYPLTMNFIDHHRYSIRHFSLS